MTARRRPRGMTAAQWNAKHPIGTPVRYWPRLARIALTTPVDTRTRSEAWELGDGSPVVLCEGRSGGLSLSHLEPIAEGGPS